MGAALSQTLPAELPVVAALRTLSIFGADQGGAYREHFAEIARALGPDIPTRLGETTVEWANSGVPGLRILTGNAGTGKTAVAEAFCRANGAELPSSRWAVRGRFRPVRHQGSVRASRARTSGWSPCASAWRTLSRRPGARLRERRGHARRGGAVGRRRPDSSRNARGGAATGCRGSRRDSDHQCQSPAADSAWAMGGARRLPAQGGALGAWVRRMPARCRGMSDAIERRCASQARGPARNANADPARLRRSRTDASRGACDPRLRDRRWRVMRGDQRAGP